MRWLSVHEALDNFLGKLFSILEDLRQIQAEKKGDAKRKASAKGHFLFWTRFSTIIYTCFLRDLATEYNSLSKLMQRRQAEGHEIVAGIEHLEAFLETSKIECESPKNKIPKFHVKTLKSLEVFLKQRLRINPDTQQMFMARGNKDRATVLGNLPRSKSMSRVKPLQQLIQTVRQS